MVPMKSKDRQLQERLRTCNREGFALKGAEEARSGPSQAARLLAKPALVVLVRDIDGTSAQLLQPQALADRNRSIGAQPSWEPRAPCVWMAMVKIGGRAVSRKLKAVLRCLAFRSGHSAHQPSRLVIQSSFAPEEPPPPTGNDDPTTPPLHFPLACLQPAYLSRSFKWRHPSRDFEPGFDASAFCYV